MMVVLSGDDDSATLAVLNPSTQHWEDGAPVTSMAIMASLPAFGHLAQTVCLDGGSIVTAKGRGVWRVPLSAVRPHQKSMVDMLQPSTLTPLSRRYSNQSDVLL